MASLEDEEAPDKEEPPSPACVADSSPVTDSPAPPDQAAELGDPGDLPAQREQSRSDPCSLEGSNPPTPMEAVVSLEDEEAPDKEEPPSPACVGGSSPATDSPAPPDQAAELGDPGDLPAQREQSRSNSPSLDGSSPPTPMEDPLDPFDRERLFDLLFRSQSRRLNEQRCALPCLRGAPRRPPDPTRPWRSLPATPTGSPPGGAGLFCSLTSLQAEQFFELVATAQARRLDDQRADFTWEPEDEEREWAPPEPPDQGEELYNTILTHQSQRLEEQRSDPPIPLGAQELFDLLLRVQGGRMEEQRSDPPPALLPHLC